MSDTGGTTPWRVVGSSVVGASHQRSDKPNQDRIRFPQGQPAAMPLVVALADGHGGKAYFRSDRGAEFAVETALDVCRQLGEKTWETIRDEKIKDTYSREIYLKWREKVRADFNANPFSEQEIAILGKTKGDNSALKTTERKGPKLPDVPSDDEVTAYGSTLIVCVVHDSFILLLQLGDGNVLFVSPTGEVDRALPKDERNFGNETTSLCLPEAWTDFRFRLYPLESADAAPALIMLSTDGYANSFAQESGFEQAGRDFLEMICEHPDGVQEGIAAIQQALSGWLGTVSEKGSGDDTTVGVLCNLDQITRYRNENYEITITKKIGLPTSTKPAELTELAEDTSELATDERREPTSSTDPTVARAEEDDSRIDQL